MAVPLSYSWRNLVTRRLTTTLTAGGMALVVFVFTATLMLAEGLRQTLVSTGSPGNVIVLRKGSETEVQSGLERVQASAMTARAEIAPGSDGRPLAAREMVVLIGLTKKSTGKTSNVVIRGIEPASLALRSQVRLVSGRAPQPGTPEIMVGKAVAKGFEGAEIGQNLRFGKREWPIVGLFDAGSTGFSSEIWGDADQLMPAFGRNAYSIVVAGLREPGLFEAFKEAVEADPRLQAEVWRETRYYEKQSDMMRKFLTVLGVSLTLIFSLGAMIGAMITMYASVAGRVAEIGTLRALGFTRGAVLLAFLAESTLLGLIGGLAGVGLAAGLSFLTFSTTNFQTFSELAFRFTLAPWIVALSLAFSLFMGVVGGFLPALRASRLGIVEALREG
ncbi:MAG: ABC-type transport system, involved in lipoprotein release, permease component [Solidesulfovibrio magneticus str. Maddingley MBC34]|uniref:ABC-type transport system, involved in lipoprotein release, permease component n=1 Tax=Solidesulfovibrio magneticus str. Maddingley MBC34 TaxID=1206767 RepID=K6GQI9_9BACT|nr:MAG: ABC-type transport system, involved in lipoprotein release, permease component [Solidesulfovibrio magneticus str. Maddingley MBC34]